MKITFVVPAPNLAGGTRVIATHADRLKARGHTVTVVAQPVLSLTRNAKIKSILRGTWPREPERRSHFDGMQAELRIMDHVGPATDADVPDADVVIATWWETAFAVEALSPSKGKKFYFIQHDEGSKHFLNDFGHGSYHLPLHKITIAGWLVDLMKDRYSDPDVDLVPNSVDTSLFYSSERTKNSVPSVGLMYSKTVFKGTDIGLSAITKVREKVSNLNIVSFGHKLQPDLPFPKGVHFIKSPRQQLIKELYSMCDVWLVPSRSEGFGLPILEAMACRCPVIATDTGCAKDVIEDGLNGYVVDVDDVNAMATRLLHVLSLDDGAWRSMSDAALRTAEAYSWEDASDLFEEALMRR